MSLDWLAACDECTWHVHPLRVYRKYKADLMWCLSHVQEGRHVEGHVYELTNHPSTGFGFQLSASTRDCARYGTPVLTVLEQTPLSRDIFTVIRVLLERDIPHNMVILRGTPFDRSAMPGAQVVKTILIPRKPHYGMP